MKTPKVSVDILIVKNRKVLFGMLSRKWLLDGKQVYGVPGREILFNDTIGDTVKRNLREEIGCSLVKYKIISINANYAFRNHYIGIGVLAEIKGKPKNLLPDDWDQWEWFDKDEIPENLFPAAENLLDCYFGSKMIVSE